MKDKFLDRKHELRKEFCNKFQVVSIFENHDQYTAFLEDKVCRLEDEKKNEKRRKIEEINRQCIRIFGEDDLIKVLKAERFPGVEFIRSEFQDFDGNKYEVAFYNK